MTTTVRNEQISITPTTWLNTNGSIFIKYIPNYVDKTSLRSIFGFLGEISRIDIVNISENGSGRRAFIHFQKWNYNDEAIYLRNFIASTYPTHAEYPLPMPNSNFVFHLTINTRPIPTSEMNLYQIQDWNQRLNDEFCDYKKKTDAKISLLTQDNNKLLDALNELKNEMSNMKNLLQNVVNLSSSDQYIIDILDNSYNSLNDDDKLKLSDLETDGSLNLVKDEDELQLCDIDSVEAGMRRLRDPLIYERRVDIN